MLQNIVIGEPELLGEPVRTRLGQAAAIGVRDGKNAEVCFAANGSTAEFFCLDLWTGKCKFRAEIPGEDVVWGMTVGRDGRVYLAGDMTGVLYRYDPANPGLEKIGAHPADPFVWDLAPRGDSIFGATYPKTRIFEYDPVRSVFRDWGRADDTEHYARGIAADERFLYVGLGSTAGLVRIDLSDGSRTKIDVPGVTGRQGFVERLWVCGNHLVFQVQKAHMYVLDLATNRIVDRFEADGYACADTADGADIAAGGAGPNAGLRLYFTKGNALFRWEGAGEVRQVAALPMGACDGKLRIKAMAWVNRREDAAGRVLAIVTSYGECFLYDPAAGETRRVELEIEPKPVQVQALAAVGEGHLFVGGYQRGLALWNLQENRREWELLHFPQSEGIASGDDGSVYFGTYTQACIYRFDPRKPLEPRPGFKGAGANPEFRFGIGEGQDRPFAIASGDGYVFFGTVPDYGLLDGALTIHRPETGEIRVYPGIVPKQSIVSLAYRDGVVYGGSSIEGGLGSVPVHDRAELFAFDVREGRLLHRFKPEIPGIDVPPKMIGGLAVGPDGLLWGIAWGTVFAYDRASMRLVKSRVCLPSDYRGPLYRPPALRFGPDGLMYTELARKFVVIDPETLDFRVIDEEPFGHLTLGPDGDLYQAKWSQLYRRKVVRPADGGA
ncbi:hypothetical protein Theco_1228 [Thermobacillus composti KWC4]|uniref:Pyrrolo-quinoline quinone repeat domain-containing protein n=1 Tax=Thermobacillus composti (strain DSM 18247 / JCM 13945 / KWC4) TaxID=717605 RepID=L0ECQ6_THECK|nr:PQQ-binding-like beta-propeller repeat protein [Thermobacillus composti]AGA57394.1 hypothetical protein Theco_1228 [Thermobacillus composti KWC4]